ncbi:MAG: 2OG-Fe(II) oxygenase [Kofleriaceae bacterium]|nr:2OG-Fe(II) oxygenase [Kofleriaceae bacterium]
MADLLRAYFSSDEVADLRARAAAASSGWTPGRQHTGYDILPLRDAMPIGHPYVARALALIGTPFEDYWDVYFIRYQPGAHIPPHIDAAQHGRRHRRLNAVLQDDPSGGGILFIDGIKVELGVGDAVLFSPDTEVHEVSRVDQPRLLFSVGAWV